GWGYGDRFINESKSAIAPLANANRVEYPRGLLTEWYVNGPLGIEQGFTISQPPIALSDSHNGALDIALRLRGNLSASVDPGRHAVTLRNQEGLQALRYGPLVAYDASGRELESWLEERGGLLRLRVNTAGARYPVVVDPFVQVAQLTVSGVPGGIGLLGISTGISDDGMVVVAGGCGPTAACTTPAQGQAYVFVQPTGGWANSATPAVLTAFDGASGDGFGDGVAISGDGMTIVVSAPYHTCETISSALECTGKAYVFTAPGGGELNWTNSNAAVPVLTPSVPAIGDFFPGSNLAVDYTGSTIIAREYDPSNGVSHLNVYVQPTTGGWVSTTEDVQLQPSDVAPFDNFGAGLAISGFGIANSSGKYNGTVAAGSFGANSFKGEAYVFVEPNAGWSSLNPSNPNPPATPIIKIETAKLLSTDAATNSGLGFAAAVDQKGDTVVVGALRQNNDIGEAYIYIRPPLPYGWGLLENPQFESTRLLPSDYATFIGSGFAEDLSISDDGSTISAGSDNGGVYLFSEPSGGWPTGTTSPIISNPFKAIPSITNEKGDYTALHGKVSGNASAATGSGTILVAVPGNNSDAGAVFVYGPQTSSTYALYSNAGPIDFGAVTVNTTGTYSLTLTNPPPPTGNNSPFAVNGISLSGSDSAYFSIASVSCNGSNVPLPFNSSSPPVTLNPTGTCTINLQFLPTLNQNGYAELLTIATTAVNSNASAGPSGTGQSILLIGDGVAPFATFSPGNPTYDFGNVAVGQSPTYTITLSNTGDGPLSLGGVSFGLTSSPGFSYTTTCAVPLTINAGSSCTATVKFAPTGLGASAVSLGFADNAGPGESNLSSTPGNPYLQIVSFTATGVTAIATTTTITSTSSSYKGFALPTNIALAGTTPVTVNFTVAPVTGSVTPTGPVVVEDGLDEFCSAVILTSANGGKSSCTLNIMGAGTVPITAIYTPDSNSSSLTGSASIPFNELVLEISLCGTPFNIIPGPPGTTFSFTFDICLAGNVSTTPTVATNCTVTGCTVTMVTITQTGTPGIYLVSVSITTTAGSVPPVGRQPWGKPWPLTLFVFGVFLALLMAAQLARQKQARPRLLYATGFLIALMLSGISGCSNSSRTGAPGTPPGTYTINVTVTAGAFSLTVPVTLTVTN
ncbi:MAG: choice-of-anchor D domain-containing protein, partial [Candidatus Acidiferrales bacterium]